jgi:divalent metal cation (Fe/Co/Zn/Cd) transporter
MSHNQPTDRVSLIRTAFLLEWISLAWMAVEATVALTSSVAAHSITLAAFGLDSLIELASAGVLIWRLGVELRHGQEFSEHAERLASRIGGALLFTLAVYVAASAAWSIRAGKGGEFSSLGVAVALAAIPVMYVLARRKLDIAEKLGSRAMRTDAVESIACGWLSFVVVLGLVAQLLTGLWWIDAVTSLGIVGFLVKEAREAWRGEECCSESH